MIYVCLKSAGLSYIATTWDTTSCLSKRFFPLRIMEYDNDWKYGRNYNHGINITETYWIYLSLMYIQNLKNILWIQIQ